GCRRRKIVREADPGRGDRGAGALGVEVERHGLARRVEHRQLVTGALLGNETLVVDRELAGAGIIGLSFADQGEEAFALDREVEVVGGLAQGALAEIDIGGADMDAGPRLLGILSRLEGQPAAALAERGAEAQRVPLAPR